MTVPIFCVDFIIRQFIFELNDIFETSGWLLLTLDSKKWGNLLYKFAIHNIANS